MNDGRSPLLLNLQEESENPHENKPKLSKQQTLQIKPDKQFLFKKPVDNFDVEFSSGKHSAHRMDDGVVNK